MRITKSRKLDLVINFKWHKSITKSSFLDLVIDVW